MPRVGEGAYPIAGLSRSHSFITSSAYVLYLWMSLWVPAGLPAAVSSSSARSVGHARVQEPVRLPACLFGYRACEPAFATACGPDRQYVGALGNERAGLQLVDGVAVQTAFVDRVQSTQVGIRVVWFDAFNHARGPSVHSE